MCHDPAGAKPGSSLHEIGTKRLELEELAGEVAGARASAVGVQGLVLVVQNAAKGARSEGNFDRPDEGNPGRQLQPRRDPAVSVGVMGSQVWSWRLADQVGED